MYMLQWNWKTIWYLLPLIISEYLENIILYICYSLKYRISLQLYIPSHLLYTNVHYFCAVLTYKAIIIMHFYFFRKSAFQAKHNKIHLNLSIALLLGLIVFVAGANHARDGGVSLYMLFTVQVQIKCIYCIILQHILFIHNAWQKDSHLDLCSI